MRYTILFLLFTLGFYSSYGQEIGQVTGYVFEEGNRGYLKDAEVIIRHPKMVEAIIVFTNENGKFETDLPLIEDSYQVIVNKNAFERGAATFAKSDANTDNNIFLKIELKRLPGYLLDMSMVNWIDKDSTTSVYGIEKTNIEIYNNTLQKEVLNIENHPSANIQFLLEQGNEYIFMIRKDGYYTKQMRANVNVNGCILCMEGFGDITPKVVDNLTQENTMGSLGTEISLRKMVVGENLKLEDIYYDLGKSTLRPEAIKGLNKLIQLLDNNPNIIVELSAHTDSRGDKTANLALSQRRANSVMQYIKQRMTIDDSRIVAKGYGESKLVNSCADGVRCSEEMHQKNRRTELTIIDLLVNEAYKKRSLSSIMQERNFDAILEANKASYTEADAPLESEGNLQKPSVPKMIERDYNGYKIELVAEVGAISPEHPLFYAFEKVYLDIDEYKRTSFMIHHFDEEAAAQKKLLEYKENFPSAQVVAYSNGVRQ